LCPCPGTVRSLESLRVLPVSLFVLLPAKPLLLVRKEIPPPLQLPEPHPELFPMTLVAVILFFLRAGVDLQLFQEHRLTYFLGHTPQPFFCLVHAPLSPPPPYSPDWRTYVLPASPTFSFQPTLRLRLPKSFAPLAEDCVLLWNSFPCLFSLHDSDFRRTALPFSSCPFPPFFGVKFLIRQTLSFSSACFIRPRTSSLRPHSRMIAFSWPGRTTPTQRQPLDHLSGSLLSTLESSDSNPPQHFFNLPLFGSVDFLVFPILFCLLARRLYTRYWPPPPFQASPRGGRPLPRNLSFPKVFILKPFGSDSRPAFPFERTSLCFDASTVSSDRWTNLPHGLFRFFPDFVTCFGYFSPCPSPPVLHQIIFRFS